MIVIDNVVISEDISAQYFCCNISKCKGACCIEGDGGAPLNMEEISIIEDNIDKVKPFMTKKGIDIIESQGVFDYDDKANFCTPLINDRECAYINFDDVGSLFCAFEKAYNLKIIRFKKPISCHLYPLRIDEKGTFNTIKYHKWHICKDAISCGEKNKIKLYQFLEEALIRKFGKRWYKKLLSQIEIK